MRPRKLIPFPIRLARTVIIAFIAITAISQLPSRAGASATQAADDQPTQDLLQELDRVPAAQPSATQPAGGASEPAPLEMPWKRLISDFRYMLMTAGAVGVAGAVIGLFVLLRREALIALAIPQIVAVGAAIGMRLQWENKLPPALAVALVALAYFVNSRRRKAANWIVPAFYVAGLSLSFLIIANHGQDVDDLQRLFTGVDVAVSPKTARVAVSVLLMIAAVSALLWRRWLLLAQAPAAAELAGLRPARWDAFFLLLLTIMILLGTDALGVVLVLSMLFLPAATVLPWTRRLPAAMAGGVAMAIFFLAAGFYFSNTMNWPLSQSIGGIGFAVLLVSQTLARILKRAT